MNEDPEGCFGIGSDQSSIVHIWEAKGRFALSSTWDDRYGSSMDRIVVRSFKGGARARFDDWWASHLYLPLEV
jgi:hypothetical protein